MLIQEIIQTKHSLNEVYKTQLTIKIEEAFGRGAVTNLDKEANKTVTKGFTERLGNVLAVIGGAVGLIAGAGAAFHFISPDAWETAQAAGIGLGAGLGTILGVMPGISIGQSSSSNKKRIEFKTDKLKQIINNNPTLNTDIDLFVKDLIDQTPSSILNMSNYIVNLKSSRDDGINANDVAPGTETKRRLNELIRLIYSYFSQQEKKWKNIASKYNLDPDMLYQAYMSMGKSHIETRWLRGIKKKLTSPN